MKFIILFEDSKQADPDIRKIHMKDHLAFLHENSDVIESAGPLMDQAGKGRDGLWIVNVENETQAEHLVKQDPFWPTGLRESYSIIPWKQVFCDGESLIDL